MKRPFRIDRAGATPDSLSILEGINAHLPSAVEPSCGRLVLAMAEALLAVYAQTQILLNTYFVNGCESSASTKEHRVTTHLGDSSPPQLAYTVWISRGSPHSLGSAGYFLPPCGPNPPSEVQHTKAPFAPRDIPPADLIYWI